MAMSLLLNIQTEKVNWKFNLESSVSGRLNRIFVYLLSLFAIGATTYLGLYA